MAESQQEYQFTEVSLVTEPLETISRDSKRNATNNNMFKAWLSKIGVEPDVWSELRQDFTNSEYKVYTIRQGKRAKRRQIEEPSQFLMEAQRKLVLFFEQYPLLNCCTARKGMGIRDNAAVHSDAKYVLRVDISRCYPSITMAHISAGLNIVKQVAWKNAASLLVDLCMFRNNGNLVLPTGASTSPILCNIALTPIDIEVQAIAKEYGYIYTRYIDDLHLSTTSPNRYWNLIEKIKEIITSHGLRVNKKKTKWYTVGENDKVIITGVRIKKGCSVPRQFIRMVRARLQNLAKDKLPIDSETRGCLAYIHSIDPSRQISLLEYYTRRLNYVSLERERIGTQQALPSGAGSHS